MFKMILKLLLLATLCVHSVLCCSTFDNTLMDTVLHDKSKYQLRLTGCIERIAFYQDDVQRVVVEVRIKNQKVPNLKKDAVRNMAKLKVVTIKNSGLSRLYPGAFRNVPRIQKVEFCENKLTEIPSGVFNGTTLQEISLQHNRITLIENNAFSFMSNLKTLNMSYNNLDAMSRNWFYDLPALTTADFSHNNIRTVPTKIFIHARATKYIYLDYNDISDIQRIAFEGLPNLKYLGLKHNLLKRIKENAFPSKFEYIDTLCINSNRFSYLHESFLKKIKVNTMNIDGNPWQCGCYRKLLKYVNDNQGRILPSAECQDYVVPVCVVPTTTADSCTEEDDSGIISDFYNQVEYLKNTDCVRFLETL